MSTLQTGSSAWTQMFRGSQNAQLAEIQTSKEKRQCVKYRVRKWAMSYKAMTNEFFLHKWLHFSNQQPALDMFTTSFTGFVSKIQLSRLYPHKLLPNSEIR